MSQKRSIKIIESFYQLVTISIIFWKVLLKKGVIFGYVDALYTIFIKLSISENKSLKSKCCYKPNKIISKILSILMFISLISMMLMINKFKIFPSELNQLLLVVSIIYFLLIVVMCHHYLISKEVDAISRLYYSFRNIIFDFSTSLLFLGVTVTSLYIFNLNLVVGIFIVPSLAIKMIIVYLNKKQDLKGK